MIRKVIRIGESLGITIDYKELIFQDIKEGDHIRVDIEKIVIAEK